MNGAIEQFVEDTTTTVADLLTRTLQKFGQFVSHSVIVYSARTVMPVGMNVLELH